MPRRSSSRSPRELIEDLKMRILIIGSNSFSGAHFASYALRAGHEVFGISRSHEPHNLFLPYKWGENRDENFEFLQADLNEDLSLALDATRNFAPDVVVNFAAQSMVGQSWERPQDWYQTNAVALSQLINGLQSVQSLGKYVHVTTPEVYGSTPDWIAENENFAPSTPYAVSRAAGDLHLLALHRATGFPVVFTRAANVYGPGQQLYRIIPKAALSARLGRELPLHGGGTSRRSFIHINDVADATLQITQIGEPGETYHISTDELVSISNVVARVFEIVGVDSTPFVTPAEDRVGKDSGYFLNSSKIRRELGWRPEIGLDEGLGSVIDWVTNNLEVLESLPTEYIHRP